jgi:hypothetical protein
MKKYLATLIICLTATVSTFALYNTNYYNKYGSSIGFSTTTSNYVGGTTTKYYDVYGSSIGFSYDW